VRKLARSICSKKVLLNLVNLKTKSAGDGYPKKAIEKTVLRFLGSRTFSHGLGRKLPMPGTSAEWASQAESHARLSA
jgi:hypothetical protein